MRDEQLASSQGDCGTAGLSPGLRIDAAALFQASPNPYVIFGPALTIVDMNDAYLHATMRNRADIIGRNLFEAFPSDPTSVSGRQLRSHTPISLRKCVTCSTAGASDNDLEAQ